MTTESRMREALKKAYGHLGSLACTHPHLSAPTLRQEISEALSPPARRTSYEWKSATRRWRLVFTRSWWSAESVSSGEDSWDRADCDADITDEMARLANLTPPEEKA